MYMLWILQPSYLLLRSCTRTLQIDLSQVLLLVQMDDIERERSNRLSAFKYQSLQGVHEQMRQHAIGAHNTDNGEGDDEKRKVVQELHAQLRSLHERRAELRAGDI